MFYFIVSTLMSYNFILLAAAIIPAALLLIQVYRLDRLEKESPRMLWRLVLAGVISALIALVLERVFGLILNLTVKDEELYMVLLYFVIVAFSEEGAKYFMLYMRSWKSPEFNCQYDGVVYAVFVSLGFAAWENISYVIHYGLSTAILRALTAIPGHASFGIFMGIFYGLARKYANQGANGKKTLFQILSVIIPALLHGTYDYIASTDASVWFFVIFIVVMFVISFLLVRRSSRRDRYI